MPTESLVEDPANYRFWPSRSQLGMAAFLVSLTFFFGALIFAYTWVLWGRALDMEIRIPAALWISSAVLVISGVTLAFGRRAIRRGRVSAYRSWVAATALLGLVFLASQLLACRDLFAQGVFVTANPRGNVFYTFTAFHALHLFGGLGALILLVRGSLELAGVMEEQPLRRARNRAGLVAMYWNFVIVSWLVLFALLWRWVH